jgi:Fe-S cluster assembly iron-binding protein IscA
MLKITEQAADRIFRHFQRAELEDDRAMRIVVNREGSLSWLVDLPRVDDEVLTYQGKTLVIVHRGVTGALQEKTLDVKETDDGPVFFLNDSLADRYHPVRH